MKLPVSRIHKHKLRENTSIGSRTLTPFCWRYSVACSCSKQPLQPEPINLPEYRWLWCRVSCCNLPHAMRGVPPPSPVGTPLALCHEGFRTTLCTPPSSKTFLSCSVVVGDREREGTKEGLSMVPDRITGIPPFRIRGSSKNNLVGYDKEE